MFKEIKKIWCDTTTFAGSYVSKDVMKAVSFLTGICLVLASALAPAWGFTISLEPGFFLLSYAWGVQGLKELAKYKNNTLTTDAAPGAPLSADNEPPT